VGVSMARISGQIICYNCSTRACLAIAVVHTMEWTNYHF
jgi:hypothetical protein